MAATTVRPTLPAVSVIARPISELAPMGGVLAVAAFLLLYNQRASAWVPDQYERLIEAKELLAGQLPDSLIYPPGITLLLAPFVALLGAREGTMQVMTIAFGLALVPLVYFWVWRMTADRFAATLLAGGCAIAPALVGPARSGYVDTVVTLLVVLAFYLVPILKGRSVLAFTGYGLLLALLFNIRPTNVFLVPPIVLYWLAESGVGWSPMAVARVLFSKELVAASVALVVPCAISVLAGNWYGGAYGGLVAFDRFFSNLAVYWDHMTLTWLGLMLLSVPVLIGLAELWRNQRPLALGLVSFLVLWPIVHSPFLFVDGRYMAPAVVIFLFLAATGVSAALFRRQPKAGRLARVWCGLSLAWVCFLMVGGSALTLLDWEQRASESHAGLSAEMRPVLRELPHDALIISAVTRAFSEDDFSFEYVDLFDQSVAFKEKQAGVLDLEERTQQALSEGRHVFYLYSHMEADKRVFGGVWDSFRAYLDGIDKHFEVTEVYRTKYRRGANEPWLLLEVSESGAAGGARTPPAAPVEDPGQ